MTLAYEFYFLPTLLPETALLLITEYSVNTATLLLLADILIFTLELDPPLVNTVSGRMTEYPTKSQYKKVRGSVDQLELLFVVGKSDLICNENAAAVIVAAMCKDTANARAAHEALQLSGVEVER